MKKNSWKVNLTKEINHFQKTFWTIFYWLHTSFFAIWKLITLNLQWVCLIAMKLIFVISMYFIVFSIIFENWFEKDSLNKIGVQYDYNLIYTWNELKKNSLKKKSKNCCNVIWNYIQLNVTSEWFLQNCD